MKRTILTLMMSVCILFSECEAAHLTMSGGVHQGKEGLETWYDLPMHGCFEYFSDDIGYKWGDCWIRHDGVKMCGPYVMCAADLKRRRRGDIVETSLGKAIVVDYNGHVDISGNWSDIDVAVAWQSGSL